MMSVSQSRVSTEIRASSPPFQTFTIYFPAVFNHLTPSRRGIAKSRCYRGIEEGKHKPHDPNRAVRLFLFLLRRKTPWPPKTKPKPTAATRKNRPDRAPPKASPDPP